MNENKTREQLMAEIDKLRQENIEIRLALKNQHHKYSFSEWSPSLCHFAQGGEILISNSDEEAVTEPGKYLFSDLVDIVLLRELMKSFYEATGIPHGINDADNNVVSGIGWQDICTKFHRICPQTECKCRESDSYIAAHLYDGPYSGYHCLNGLMDYATPIIVDGQHLATIILGQCLHQSPDEEYFRRQAQECGFDQAAYMEALGRVPIVAEERIKPIMKFFSQLGQLIASIGLERKRQLEAAKRTIRDRDELLSLVWETSNDGFWDWNIATGYVHYSPRFAAILGYSTEELDTYLSWENLLHPDDMAAARRPLSEHLQGKTTKHEAEYRVLAKSGGWKWNLVRGQVVARNKSGRAIRMVGVSIDITERKQVEAALRQSEEKFSQVFQSNPDLMAITTLGEGRYVEVNETFVKETGYSRQEVIGHTAQELGIWVFPEQHNHLIELIRTQAMITDYEVELKNKWGGIHSFSLSANIVNIDGKERLITVVRDITQRKRMEEQLRVSEEFFFKVFNLSPVIMTISTLEEGKILNANNAFYTIMDCSPDDVIGHQSIEFYMNPADHEIIKQRLTTNKSLNNMEIRFYTYGREQKRGLYSGEIININGEPCVLSVMVDITELREIENEMNRLSRLNLVGEIAASIGHEIRNPMTSVRGFLQMFKDRYTEDDDLLNLMIEELDRANYIITEFLSLSKRDKMVGMNPKNLNTIIRKLLPLIQAQAQSKDQNITVELGELPDLIVDEAEICQVILNLVNNGMESMSPSGEVAIKSYIENKTVVLAVQDQGYGIDHELVDKLGTPFFTTKEQGTGLGLAVCYRIAERHNAIIDMDTSSSGTTFYVRFPTWVPGT